MKRFLTNLILIISILSILVIPSFAATTSDADDIVILKQPNDTFFYGSKAHFSVIAEGENLSYYWFYSHNGKEWYSSSAASATTPNFTITLSGHSDIFVRCEISNSSSIIYTRVALAEKPPTNLFNFVKSCLRYVTSYISLIVNSLVTPGAPLYALLPVLCIGIAVAALLIVIKIIKGFSWGM